MRNVLRAVTMVGAVGLVAAWSIARGAEDADPTNSAAYRDLGALSPETRETAIAALLAGSTSLLELQSGLEQEASLLVKAGLAEVIVRRGPSAGDVGQLATSLLASDVPTRLEAARILGRTRPATAATALTRVAESGTEVPEVRAAAAVALGRAGSSAQDALTRLSERTDLPMAVRAGALRGLALSGEGGVAKVATLASTSKTPLDLREAALRALGDPDVASEAALFDLMKSAMEGVRARALDALVARGEKTTAAADALAERLEDGSSVVRRASVEALVSLGGAVSKKAALLDRLADGEEVVRIAAIEALGRAFTGGDAAVADALAGLMDEDSFAIRYHAAVALGRLKDARGLDAMTNHRETETDEERAAADDAAAQIRANTN